MKTIIKLAILLMLSFVAGCQAEKGLSNDEGLDDHTMNVIIGEVDKIALPIPAAKVAEFLGEGGTGDYLLKIDKTQIDKLEGFKGGSDIYLMGSPSDPRAVMIYSNDNISTYIIPFKGVTELDRPRRLIKLKDRFFSLLSNRSSEGTSTQSVR